MGGGTSINSISFESWPEVDIRSGDPVKIAAIDEVLQQSIQSALDQENAGRRRGPELTVEAKLVGVRPAAPGNLESPLVQRAMAVLSSFAVEPEPSISSTDANLPLSLGIPAVTLSRGGVSGDAHSPQEWWQDKDSHIGMQAAFLTTLIESGFVN